MRKMGTWWDDESIEIYEIEGKPIALWGWNGEYYLDCWEVEKVIDGIGYDIKIDGLEVRPVYIRYSEDEYEIEDYELI